MEHHKCTLIYNIHTQMEDIASLDDQKILIYSQRAYTFRIHSNRPNDKLFEAEDRPQNNRQY